MESEQPKRHFRIAQVTGHLSGAAGGAPRAVADHVKAVEAWGVDAAIFCGYSKAFPLEPGVFGLENNEIVTSRIVGPDVLGLCIVALFKLWRRAREFDVIHLNGAWNFTTFIAAHIAKNRKVPYIITPHSHYGAYHFSRNRYQKQILHTVLERSNIKSAARIHCTSDWECQTSRHAIGSSNVIKIPLPTSLGTLLPPINRLEARRRLGIDTDAFCILSFGRIARQKNPDLLLSAFLHADITQNSLLYFIGPAETQVLHRLKKIVARHDADTRVRFVDYVEGDVKKYWLSACDLFALPSNDDNFCIAALEAAASGTYLLVSPNVGAVEYLPESSTEVCPLTESEWTAALTRLSHAQLPQKPLDDTMLLHLSPKSIAQQWIDVYTTLTSKTAPES